MAFATAEDIVKFYNDNGENDYVRRMIMDTIRVAEEERRIEEMQNPVTQRTPITALSLQDRFARIVSSVPNQQMEIPARFTVDHANRWLDALKQSYLKSRLGKGFRPWEVVDVCATLDPNQNWIGVEYETGYESQEHYAEVINFVWDNFLYSVVDYEGCGSKPCEITFAPVTQAEFMSDKYCMDRLMNYATSKSIFQDRPESGWCDECSVYHPPHGMIGIHCNISTPSFRKSDNYTAIGRIMARSVRYMDQDDQYILFGRKPYGTFSAMQTQKGHRYMEGKLFDTTGNPEVWYHYKHVIARMAELVEHLSAHYDELTRKIEPGPYVYNFTDILLGHAPVEDAELDSEGDNYDGEDYF